MRFPKDCKSISRVIDFLYIDIQAFSAGCGDGTFLFEVFGGVRTGCPLSSILFFLCCDPFIDVVLWLSDGPRCSVTWVCADDFGSALKSLSLLSKFKRLSSLWLLGVLGFILC